MARRKKKSEGIVQYTPSKYQEAIFNFIQHDSGNLVVEASAGAGKTWTLIKCLEYIPEDKKVLMAAFNTDIVNELKKKVNGKENVDIRTLHSLGLLMLKKNFPYKALVPEVYKYTAHIKANIKQYSTINTYALGNNYFNYVSNIEKYVDFGRFYLCQTVKDLDMIEERYGIDTLADEKEIALKVMEWGKEELDVVDFVDMIWLPNVLYLKPIGLLFDFIFIDECQDLNRAERELILKCFKMGTRMVSVGDKNQCCYAFSGSDPESFEKLVSLPNTKKLPLSISYRCSKNIVDFAKRLVPSIEANDDGRLGVIKYDVSLSDVQDGDMVICRNNAPLAKVYNELLKDGKKAFIRGKDIGTNLKSYVKSTKQTDLNRDCYKDGVFARLYYDLFITRNKIMKQSNIDAKTAMSSPIIENKLDMIRTLEVLSEGILISDELIEKIDTIFSKKNKKEGIALSTIHKAKGLEANNVYIVCKSLMPSKSAKKGWEIRQEHNLMYVAYTRAKDTLGFINEKEFKDFDSSSTNSQSKLTNIEKLVNVVLGKSTNIPITKENAKEIIRNATVIEGKQITTKIVDINSGNKIKSFSDMTKRRKSKIKR